MENKSFSEVADESGIIAACALVVTGYTGMQPATQFHDKHNSFVGYRDADGVLWVIDNAEQGDGHRISWGRFVDEPEDHRGSFHGIDAIFDEVCEFARHLELNTLGNYIKGE